MGTERAAMRTALMVVALVSSLACGADDVTTADTQSPAGIWALKTYNGAPLPYTKAPVGSVVDRVTDGTITFVAPNYVIDISFIRTIGGVVSNVKYYEVGSYTSNATGIVLRPDDVPGGTGNTEFLLPPVPVSRTGNTLSFMLGVNTVVFERR
jgi:hypothetical protein